MFWNSNYSINNFIKKINKINLIILKNTREINNKTLEIYRDSNYSINNFLKKSIK